MQPIDDDGDEADIGEEVCVGIVVAGCDGAPILEPTQGARDDVGSLVGCRVEGHMIAPGRHGRDDGDAAVKDHESVQRAYVADELDLPRRESP